MVETSVKIHRRDIEELASKSLVNCHTVGVDSVMLRDVNEDRLRAFVVHDNHALWKNYTIGLPLSIAVHTHHCDVTLTPVYGSMFNVAPVESDYGKPLTAYRYESQIKGVGKFVMVPGKEIVTDFSAALVGKQGKRLKAKEAHTVYVASHKTAAWFVHEGKEDPTYENICWSDADLCAFDFAPLYKPMSVDRFKILLDCLRVEVVK